MKPELSKKEMSYEITYKKKSRFKIAGTETWAHFPEYVAALERQDELRSKTIQEQNNTIARLTAELETHRKRLRELSEFIPA